MCSIHCRNPSDDTFDWPQYSIEEQKYAILKVDRIDVKQKWNSQNCQFWNFFYPKLVKKTVGGQLLFNFCYNNLLFIRVFT